AGADPNAAGLRAAGAPANGARVHDPGVGETGVHDMGVGGAHPNGARADGTRANGARADGTRANGAHANGAHANGQRVDGPGPAGVGVDRVLGSVTVVGLGPAGPDWLTPEAAAALAGAEHVVGYQAYVSRVPPRAGQHRHLSDNRVEAERAAFALELARRGGRVAVVSSGDPGVFAMAAAVLEVRADGGYGDVPVHVLPGVTAANAVAARAGAPLGHDYCVVSLSDQLKPWPLVLRRLRAAAEADLALALYNPGSRARRRHVDEVRACLLGWRSPDTPVVVGRAVGEPGPDGERVDVIRLADLTAEHVDMRTLLIVGSSRTRWDRATGVVFTPRHHDGAPSPATATADAAADTRP
ncbi:precorrin-3B C(17)-methyltransferase, partial [Frankia nepalensis]|uniref:precorrin-3B C(17)-methyltransferase n=1 Tax=Frankia nepalensis TaxID=1836974 RepID=UPI001D3598A7